MKKLKISTKIQVLYVMLKKQNSLLKPLLITLTSVENVSAKENTNSCII